MESRDLPKFMLAFFSPFTFLKEKGGILICLEGAAEF
jgi:hypothetical protein